MPRGKATRHAYGSFGRWRRPACRAPRDRVPWGGEEASETKRSQLPHARPDPFISPRDISHNPKLPVCAIRAFSLCLLLPTRPPLFAFWPRILTYLLLPCCCSSDPQEPPFALHSRLPGCMTLPQGGVRNRRICVSQGVSLYGWLWYTQVGMARSNMRRLHFWDPCCYHNTHLAFYI